MLEEKYNGHLHFIHGECTDVEALATAHADTADRVLILPYTTWQDYRVGNSLSIIDNLNMSKPNHHPIIGYKFLFIAYE